MSAAYDRRTTDELEPDCLDEDVDGEELERIDDGEIPVEDEAPAPTKAAPPVLCVRCGQRPPYDRDFQLPGDPCRGWCWGCRQAARQGEIDAEQARHAERVLEREREHAERRARIEAGPACPDCGVKNGFEGLCPECEKKARQARARTSVVRRAMAALPVKYRDNGLTADCSRARVKDPSVLARTAAACAAHLDTIVFVGPAAAGKTTAAAGAYRVLVEQYAQRLSPTDEYDTGEDVPGMYLDARTASLARVNHSLGSESPVVDRAIAAAVLLFDDVGIEGDVARSAVPDILYARHHACLTTIVTTTLTPEGAAQKYGDGIARRLFEQRVGAHVIAVRPGKAGAK